MKYLSKLTLSIAVIIASPLSLDANPLAEEVLSLSARIRSGAFPSLNRNFTQNKKLPKCTRLGASIVHRHLPFTEPLRRLGINIAAQPYRRGLLGRSISTLGAQPPASLPEVTPEELRQARIGPAALRYKPSHDLRIASTRDVPAWVKNSYRNIDLYLTPAKNQRQAGTCQSFAVIASLEAFFPKWRPFPAIKPNLRDLSEAQLIDNIIKKFKGGKCPDPEHPGLSTMQTMQIARDIGVVEEARGYWEYNDKQLVWNAPPSIDGRRIFKFNEVNYVFEPRRRAAVFNLMKSHLHHNLFVAEEAMPEALSVLSHTASAASPIAWWEHPIIGPLRQMIIDDVPPVVSIPVWFKKDGTDIGWDNGPRIRMPQQAHLRHFLEHNTGEDAQLKGKGWHAVTLCTYNDTCRTFRFKNSWDKYWGAKGFGEIPYQYLIQYSDCALVGKAPRQEERTS